MSRSVGFDFKELLKIVFSGLLPLVIEEVNDEGTELRLRARTPELLPAGRGRTRRPEKNRGSVRAAQPS